MEFNTFLFILLYVPQILVVAYFNKKNVQNTGKNKGSNNTASAAQALIFGIFTTIVCPPVLYYQYSLGGANTFETDFIMIVAISFFASHITFVLVAKKFNSELIHHLICLATLLYSLLTQTFGQDLLLTIFLGEITFIMYVKIIAKNNGMKKIENICEDIFVFMLTPLRLIVFPTYLYFFITSPEAQLIPGLLAIAYVGLGLQFVKEVLKRWLDKKNGMEGQVVLQKAV